MGISSGKLSMFAVGNFVNDWSDNLPWLVEIILSSNNLIGFDFIVKSRCVISEHFYDYE